jgi:REP element-mobilizing transposase RayT
MRPLKVVIYLLTFNCYGTHLRGDEKGSVDRARETRGGPIEPSVALVNYGNRIMTHAAASLDLGDSFLVLNAIQETCAFRQWTLLAAHVRSTHVHLVADGIIEASSAMRDLKGYASRALNSEGVRRRWARGGSARMLRDSRAVRAAVRYVVDCQGPPMAAYIAPDL